jgi:hypothetical protein
VINGQSTRLFDDWYGNGYGWSLNAPYQVTLETCATAASLFGSTLFGMQFPQGDLDATTAECFLNMRHGAQQGDSDYTKLADSECALNGGSITWNDATYTYFGGGDRNAIYSILDCAAGAYRGGVV